jgi:hypothetical protein
MGSFEGLFESPPGVADLIFAWVAPEVPRK